jgi:phage head maturation protease
MNAIDTARGYAVVWGARSVPIADNGVTFVEMIAQGAATWYGDVSANYGHAAQTGFASTTDKSLRIWADDCGVAFECDIAATLKGVGVRAMLADTGRAWGCSPLLRIYGRESTGVENGFPIERLTRCRIEHISVTDTPCYAATSIWLKSSPPDRLRPEIRVARRRWHLSVLAAESKVQAPTRRRPEPIQIDGLLKSAAFLQASRAMNYWQCASQRAAANRQSLASADVVTVDTTERMGESRLIRGRCIYRNGHWEKRS